MSSGMPGKPAPRSDVDDLCAVRKQPMRQRRGAVQIVTVYALILIQHSGQIHPCVVFIQNGMKRFKTLQCCFVRGNAHSVKTGLQSFSVHSRMLSHINFTQLSPSRRWFLMKYFGLEGLPLARRRNADLFAERQRTGNHGNRWSRQAPASAPDRP